MDSRTPRRKCEITLCSIRITTLVICTANMHSESRLSFPSGSYGLVAELGIHHRWPGVRVEAIALYQRLVVEFL